MPATNQLSLAIGLPLRNQDQLTELLHQLYDPTSTNFHKYLTSPEFTARFGPTETDYQAVIRFARANGLRIDRTHPNRVVLDVTGSAAEIEQAFQVRLQFYQHPAESRKFYAPDVEPSVPTNVPMADLWGLSDYARPTPLARPFTPPTTSPLNYNGTGPGGSYRGSDFRNAYAPGTPLAGSGQIAAVAEFDGYYASDIATYLANSGYSNVPLQNVLLNNVSGTPGYSGVANAVAEVSLDIELLIAMAPGLSKLVVYEGNNPYTVFNQIATDNTAKQISCSWAFSKGPTYEWAHGPGTYTLDVILSQMVAQGQSFFQASGDADAYTGSQALSSTKGPIPVDSIYVTSVGGTTLTMNGSGVSWASETTWNWGNNTGSGGGVSPNYSIPSWQANVSMTANSGSTVNRNIPDVALTADANNVIYNNGSSGTFGGTSCAAPLWAGFTALVNQQAVASGSSPVGFLNPALYTIAAGPNYPNCFHDITTGNNIGNNTPGLFYAVTNYDLATGLGTPNGTNLINALAPPTFPYFISQPSSQTVTNGANVAFIANVGGQPPLSYRWLFNSTNLPAGGNVSGTTNSTLNLTAVTAANAGNYSVIVTNNYGSVTSSVATLTVTYPPSFTAQPTNQSAVVGATVVFSATVSGASPLTYQWRTNGINLINGGSLSGATSNVLTLSNLTAANAGNYTLLVTNVYGAATSSVASLTVLLPPIITTPLSAQTIQCGSNASFSVVASGTSPLSYRWSTNNILVAGATNASLSLTNVHLPGYPVTVIVTNLYGSATSSVPLSVQDTLAPALTLNSTNPFYVELGGVYNEPGATANDLCAGALSVAVSGSVNTAAVSTNVVTYIATDGNGNTNTATRTVIVRDTTPPVITWSFTNLVLAANSNCAAAMPNVTGTNYIQATDLSLPLTITQSPTNNAALPLATNVIVITVVDAYGNKAYSTNRIAVHDITPPVITLNGFNPMTNQLGAIFTDPGATASDTCSGIALLTTNGVVTTNAIGTNVLTYSAVDGSGNTNFATRTVFVVDTTPPTILWSFTNLVLVANSNCFAAMPNVTGTNYILATDLSLPLAITQSPPNNASLPLGTNVVVITVADTYGNKAYSTNRIAVHDATPPVITMNGYNPMTNELGSAFADPGVTASDACSGIAQLATNGAVNVNVVGTNLLTYAAVDGSGNTNTATRTVFVSDTTPPTILWSFTNLVLPANSNCVAAMPDATGTNFILATDLSGALTFTQDPTNNFLLPLGTNVVVITVADASGNQSYSTNWIAVRDQTPPVIVLNGFNPMTNELGAAFTDPGATASDACSGIALLLTNGLVNANVVATNLLTYVAVDGGGNTNVATRTVFVCDTTSPTISWSFTNLALAANSNCVAALPDVTGTNYILATDLSGVAAISQTPTNGAILQFGTNAVVLAVADPYGNTSYSTNQIVVADQTPPLIVAQPQSQTNGAGATVSFSVAAIACTPLSFQWYFNDASLSAQTNSSLTLSNLTVASAGNYFVVATASGGSTTSTAAMLVLSSPTVVTLASSADPSGFKDNVNFAAIVAPTNATGSIQFLANGAAFDAEPLVNGMATSTNLPTLPRGTNQVSAIYSGDTNFLPATNSIAQIVTNHPPVVLPAFYTLVAGLNLNIAVADLATNWSDIDGDALTIAGIGTSTNGVVITNSLPTLFYSNQNYVNDQFVCTVSDGFGGTNLETVSITVVPQTNSTPFISNVAIQSGGGVKLSLTGGYGSTYILESRANLASGQWESVATNTLGITGTWQFTDEQATNYLQRFYRLQLVP